MEQLNSVFNSINEYQHSDLSLVESTTCLWIWHADKIPPHLGISSKGKYFSLKVKGKDWQVPVSILFDTIERKKIPTLCLVLKTEASSLEEVFGSFEHAKAQEVTCLFPIREALKLPHALQLQHLIGLLGEEERIDKCFGFNLPSNFIGIPDYEIKDIHDRLEQLSNG